MMIDTLPPRLGLADLADRYDVVLSDVWGVLHNGVAAWPEAGEALARFRSRGGAVVLISNAPRPSDRIVPMLDAMGVPRAAWDGFVSSGDLARHEMLSAPGRRVHHIGPERDHSLFEGLGVRRTGVDDCDVAVVTGLHDDETETPEDYRPTLDRLAARGLTLICANPDRIVERGHRMVWCAGAIADLYEEMGREVVWLGKPHPAIYARALEVAASVLKRPADRTRILAVGDALRTDLAGANAQGMDCLFMTGGIHGPDLGDPAEPEKLAALLANAERPPVAWAKRLAWRL